MMTLNRLFLIFLTTICFSLNTGWASEEPEGFEGLDIIIWNETGETIPYFSSSGNWNLKDSINTFLAPGHSRYHIDLKKSDSFSFISLVVSTKNGEGSIGLNVTLNNRLPFEAPTFSINTRADGTLHADSSFSSTAFPRAILTVRITK